MPVAMISTRASPAFGPSRSIVSIERGFAASQATAARVLIRRYAPGSGARARWRAVLRHGVREFLRDPLDNLADAETHRIDGRQLVVGRERVEIALRLAFAERLRIDRDADRPDGRVGQPSAADGEVDHVRDRRQRVLDAAHKRAGRLVADDEGVRLRAM